MATQGPLFPGTVANLSNAGTSESSDAWTNPTNVTSDNATEATIVAASYDSPDISQILVCSNFNFNSVAGTVDGITVEVDRRSIVANSGKDFRVQLATGTAFANLVGTNKAVPATIWPTSSTVATYGGVADTWSAGLTAAQVAASGFAVFISCQANIANADVGIDFVRVTVAYTPSAGITSTATWSQAAAGWAASAKEAITGTATFVQAAAGWEAAANERLTATATFMQAPAAWDASATHTESGIGSTATWTQPAASWSAQAAERISATASVTQAAAGWAAQAKERLAATSAFAQAPAGWSAQARTPIQSTASFAQTNSWQAIVDAGEAESVPIHRARLFITTRGPMGYPRRRRKR